MKMTRPHYEEKLAQHSAAWRDRYAITMAQAFYTNGKHDLPVTFHAYIRNTPFKGGYLVTGGQNIIREWLGKHWKFDDRDLDIMRAATVPDMKTGAPVRLFTDDFIEMCRGAKMELTIDAMPEGELAFPDEPIYRVHGPLWQCLLVEAAILNTMNSQSLFATLASRLVDVAEGAPILEFGLRRAQCIGGLEASRGAFLGGVAATSNDLANKYYDIPAAGTFAHALVMTYEDELTAFKEYIGAMPHNGIFLVDTYDTLEGVKKAVQACKDNGFILKGIRLDSGDLTYLSKEARKILDDAGFTKAVIAASNDLDEETIAAIKREGGKVDVWGVGTNLVTAKAQPALGGVFKLGAVFKGDLSQAEIEATRQLVKQGQQPHTDPDFVRNVIKLSEQAEKTTIPGELDLLRYVTYANGKPVRFNGDTIISNLTRDPVKVGVNSSLAHPDVLAHDIVSVRKNDETLRKVFRANAHVYRPLVRMFDQGAAVGAEETVHDGRARAQSSLALLDSAHRRLKNPHLYVVGLEEGLYQERKQKIISLRQGM
jgi:nicotinate phosphoribosyltransferase